MNAKEAREIIELHKKFLPLPDCPHCQANGYFKALEGEEVKVLVREIERMIRWPAAEKVYMDCKGLKDSLAQYRKAVGIRPF